ncbi:MAG TPA: hypothetical protein VIM89_16585 [Mucilaginibacter sp.]
MTRKEIIYSVFYVLVFALAIWSGRVDGFTDSLTPSIPFAIEFFTLIIGAVLLAAEFAKHENATFKKIRVHLLGLTANSMLMLYVLLLAL